MNRQEPFWLTQLPTFSNDDWILLSKYFILRIKLRRPNHILLTNIKENFDKVKERSKPNNGMQKGS